MVRTAHHTDPRAARRLTSLNQRSSYEAPGQVMTRITMGGGLPGGDSFSEELLAVAEAEQECEAV